MGWTDITITTPIQYAEIVEFLAAEECNEGIYTEDYSNLEKEVDEIAHVDLIEEDLLLKDRANVKIHIYIEGEQKAIDTAHRLRSELTQKLVAYTVQLNGIKEEDWANEWRKYYHARSIGKRLAIVPRWEDYTPNGRTIIFLEPGMAFGTGTHETTSLCLEILDEKIQGGERVLDIGTGSGILAIAAMKLGASCADAIDLDAVAVRTAQENAEINNITQGFYAVVGDLSNKASGKYDVICANIVANAIIALSPAIPSLLNRDGIFIASGIIDSRVDEVKAAIENANLLIKDVRFDNGWAAIISVADINN